MEEGALDAGGPHKSKLMRRKRKRMQQTSDVCLVKIKVFSLRLFLTKSLPNEFGLHLANG